MSKPILVVTTRLLDAVEARIEGQYQARRNPKDTPFRHDELLEIAEGADAMLITPYDRLDSDFFSRVSPSVKVIATHSVGYEHIDLHGASERKIVIANTQGANGTPLQI